MQDLVDIGRKEAGDSTKAGKKAAEAATAELFPLVSPCCEEGPVEEDAERPQCRHLEGLEARRMCSRRMVSWRDGRN